MSMKNAKEEKMENHRIIQVEDKVPLKLLIPLSIQHMFARSIRRWCCL